MIGILALVSVIHSKSMNKANQNWVRLGKNLSTLIVVVTIAIFFYEYKPKKEFVISKEADSVAEVPTPVIIEEGKLINPNTASFEDFLSVGFSEKQARSCLNYRNKGGVFYRKEDVLKIYSISEEDYAILQDHIDIPGMTHKVTKREEFRSVKNKEKESVAKKEKHVMVELNACDTTDLKQLPKIGSFRAKKIVEYREKLGGFYSVEQLSVIYSMDSASIKAISPYVTVSKEMIQKINVNTVSFKEINKHPLISFEQTKKIFAYKKIVGTIKNLDELLKNNILEEKEYNILQFYLKTID
ncbi:MAG: helix-hairpin-helix domain-containing protein [Bacteroidales bacterium]|nr:helix-hairpin-helix domain-containing protein [Bacteroidales bacterium]